MLDKIFDMENPFWSFLNKLVDVIILEVLWIVTSLPLFTVGASSSAFWHVMLRLSEDTEGKIAANYFTAFKNSFKVGTFTWLIQFAVGLWVFLDLYVCFKMESMVSVILLGVFFALAAFWLMVSMFLYPLIGRFTFPLKKVIGNSAFLSLKHFPHTLCIILLQAAAFAVCYWTHSAYLVVLLPALAFYLDAKFYNYIFSLYMEKDEEDDEEDEEEEESK